MQAAPTKTIKQVRRAFGMTDGMRIGVTKPALAQRKAERRAAGKRAKASRRANRPKG